MSGRTSSLRFVAAAAAIVLAALPAAAQQRVGVNAAVNADANGTPPGGATRQLVIGQEVVHNERIKTDTKGQTQILFIDGSSVSVGPGSDLMIDEFVYDPATGTGKMTLTEIQGAMRFVGGKLSKQDNAVTLHIGTATIGVRGGVFVADVKPGGQAEVIFVYGKSVSVTGKSGCAAELHRPGFAVNISGAQGCPDSPHAAPPGAAVAILAQLDGRSGGHGGATTVPTETTVVSSGIANTVSSNVAASVQQAVQNAPAPAAAPPAPTVTLAQVPSSQTQTASSQSQSVVVNPTPPTPPPPPSPTVVNIAGLAKIAPAGSITGFIDQSAGGRIPYTGAIIYPDGSLQNGVATGSTSGGTVFTVAPLSAGATTIVGAVASGANTPAIGTVTESADSDFFFGNLTTLNSAAQPISVFGGVPVAPPFFTAKPVNQFLAFNIQPDIALANGSQAQTIPFLPSFAGGSLGNATVSPLLALNPANTVFGSHNNVSNPNVLTTPYLQASFALNGTGANQSSALVITTGAFSTSSDNGQVVLAGRSRGTVFTTATSQLQRISATSTTVPDANGNSLFGGNSIDGFVVDQNAINLAGNFSLNTATAQTYVSGTGLVPTSYAFNQPVTATALPTGTGANRSALNETGYFGGMMQCCSTNTTTNAIINYGLGGTVSLQTDPTSNRLAATFTAGAPFVSTSPNNQSPLTNSGLNALTLQFGSLPASGQNYGRSTFIDNSTFAAQENPNISSVIGRMVNGAPLVTTLPTTTSATDSSFAPQLALVTSNVVANNSLVPGGALCACQFSQWGFWTGMTTSPNTTNSGFAGSTTFDVASINTWIAGTPTVTLPPSGSGSYSGYAVGTVYNGGAQYLASGGLVANYNFATNVGTLTISNFDGNTFSGIVSGISGTPSYAASLSGPNLAGSASGTFFGPSASETGGNFGVASQSGTNYYASGVFGGASTGTAPTQPFVSYVSGTIKNSTSAGAAPGTGFSVQTGTGRETYSGGMITYLPGTTLQNGIFTIPTASTGDPNCPCVLGPLTAGSTNAVAATNSGGAVFTGTATMSPDGNFFFANASGTAGNTNQVFYFGGVPVNQNFYAGNLPAQVLAFQLQPDGALANGSVAQAIPFLPSFGVTTPNAVVSNLYVGTGANSPFGFADASNGYTQPKFLQASLAFNGQGASQASALVVATGDFFANVSSNGLVAAAGPVRGTVMLGNSANPVHVSSGLATVPDAGGNNLFGGSTLDGFVLDQNSYNFNGTALNLQLASAAQFGQTTANYAFNQPALATALPANVAAGAVQNLNETGYFGGLMTFSGNTSLSGNPYALSGTTAVQSTASNYRVAATFTGSDAFTAPLSGINTMVLAFGALNQNTPAGTNSSRGTYINNNIYAATDSPITASSINGNDLALPPNSTAATPSPSLAMVTSGTVPNAINAILPNGVTPCSCQFLQWGYWTGQVQSTTSQGLGSNRTDRAFINTWVAGMPTVTMPASGTGNFSGAAIGTVFNGSNGASYVAAGGFNQSYNFGTRTGTVNITNFDGASYSAAVAGTGRTFGGTLTGVANRTGAVSGGFFGPNAVETGGNFGVMSTAGPKYIASGIFAGR